MHVVPDFHGRRSPDPDPHARGIVTGLPLDASFDALCRLYWRACVGIALGLRAVLEHFRAHGVALETLHVTGGHARNPLLMELYADATGCRVVEPGAPDGVLLGSAMVAAAGAGVHPSLAAAAAAMHQPGTPRAPGPGARYERDWAAFQALRRGDAFGAR
jgi:ribulose kinase